MAAPRTSNVTYSLSENSPSNSYLGNLYTDTSIRTLFGSNTRNNLRYHKVTTSNPQAGFFKVHPRSGNLSTASVIDREAVCPKMTNCVLKFEVLLRPNQYFTVITVTVIIEDVNDNTPSFTQGSITLSVSEGTYPGETFLLPTPSDNDSPKFGIVSYDLRSNNTHFGLKKVNNGDSDLLMLRINSRLDREVSHKYHMTLSATDGGNPSKTGILDINVNVADINDNRPVFSNSSYIIYIPEDVKIGSVILNCTATDADVGLNGEIKYTLSSTSSLQYGSLFEINEITGALSVKDNLNYETQPLIVLTVKAQDQGPSSIPTFARVTIHLIDENDNDPTITFQQSDHRPYLSISENSPVGSVVSYLTIWDPDEGQNGNVSCVVIGRNFTLQQLFKSEYQLIVANPLPTVKGLEYLVTIVCEDHGRIRRKTEKTVLVKVEDINDHAPEFDQPEYTVKIDENISVGTSVLRVVATDGDSGNNSKISYFLFDRDNHFQIDRNYGIIYSNAEIDYESRQGYVFIVMARDHGKPPKSTNTTLRIVVNNRNDEKPEFRNNPIVLGIRENEPVNSEVGTVVAYDRDSPPLNDIRYSLRKDSEMEPAFKINANTGVISTIKDLDRETKSLYRLTVHATDAHDSSLFSTASVTIHIADANDHRPVFKFPTSKGSKNSITVTSSDEIGHIVCHVIVSDEDAGQNGKFFHSIKSGNNDKLFAINPRSGVITLNKNLPSNKKIYDLIIVAQDYGKTPLWSEEHLYILVNHTGSSMASAITDPMYPLPPVVGVSVAAGIIILALGLLLINLRFEIFSRRKCCCGRFASKDNINRDIGQAMAKVPNKEAALEQGYQGQNIMDCNKQVGRWITFKLKPYNCCPAIS